MTIDKLGGHTDGGLITVGQDLKEDTSNKLDNLLSNSVNNSSDFVTTAGGTLNLNTPQANLDQYLASGLIRLTGTPAGAYTIIVPDGDRRIAFENASGQTATIDTVTGATPAQTLVDGVVKAYHIRGIEISLIADDSSVSGILLADGTVNPTGAFNWADNELARAELKDYAETRTAPAAAATIDLDLETGNVFEPTLDQNTTFTFSNPPATGIAGSFTLIIIQDGTGGWVTTWPGTVDWPSGVAPVLTTGIGDVNILSFLTVDAGARWYGFTGGIDFG